MIGAKLSKRLQSSFLDVCVCLSFVSCSAPGGDLQTLMDDDMVPYERDAVKFVRQVLEGLLFLHERNMAHLDIKVKQQCHSMLPPLVNCLFIASCSLPYLHINVNRSASIV